MALYDFWAEIMSYTYPFEDYSKSFEIMYRKYIHD